MNANKIIKELEEERQMIERALETMKELAAGRGQKRRGRPPAWMASITRRGRPPGSKNKKVDEHAVQ